MVLYGVFRRNWVPAKIVPDRSKRVKNARLTDRLRSRSVQIDVPPVPDENLERGPDPPFQILKVLNEKKF